jgi:crossover junction endodeoxyribonuclease RuvC
MVVLGVDPGFALIGWSVVDGGEYVAHGAIETKATETLVQRLHKLHRELYALLDEYGVEHVAVEKLFFNTNSKTVIDVSQARGVILLTAEMCGMSLFEYTPLQVKMALTGYGRADKQQVQRMVKEIFRLSAIPKPDDAADALAVAYCHGVSYK